MAQWLPSDNPNSAHQTWSRWAFLIHTPQGCPPLAEIQENARRYFAAGFRTHAGRINVVQYRDRGQWYTMVVCEVEGPPVNDTGYRDAVLKDFKDKFAAKMGPGARVKGFWTTLLAGSPQDGRPSTQLLVLPELIDGVNPLKRG